MSSSGYFLSNSQEPYIHRFLASDPDYGVQELLELDTCRRLLHPSFHLSSGFGVSLGGETGLGLGLIMRFPLPTYTFTRKMGELSGSQKTYVLGTIGYALLALHQEGLYHGDVREENIGFLEGETPVLTNWNKMGRGEKGRRKDVRDFLVIVSRVLGLHEIEFEGPMNEVLRFPVFSRSSPNPVQHKIVSFPTDKYPEDLRDLLKFVVHWYRNIPSSTTRALFLGCDLVYRVGFSLRNQSVNTKIAWAAAIVWIGLKYNDLRLSLSDLLQTIKDQNPGVTGEEIRKAELQILDTLRGCIWRHHLYSYSRSVSQLKQGFDEFVLTINKYTTLTSTTLAQWSSQFPSTESPGSQNILVSSFF